MIPQEPGTPTLRAALNQEPGEDELRLGDLARAIGRQWRWIAAMTLVTTSLAAIYVLTARPQFAIHGSLYLGAAASGNAQGPTVPSSLAFLSDFQSVSNVETQIELIEAQALVERAVLQTGLNAPVTPVGAPDLVYWRWRLLHGEQVAAFRPRAGALIAQFARFARPVRGSIGYRLIIGPHQTYRITTRGGWFAKPKPVLTGHLGEPAAGSGLSLLLKPAAPSAPPAQGRQFILSVAPAQAVAAHLTDGALTVASGGTVTQPTQNANITLRWGSPYQGQRFVSQLMQDFIASQLSWKTQSASATEAFIAGQLKSIRKAFATANRKLAHYQSATGVLDVPANAKAVIDQLSHYQVQRTSILLRKDVLQRLAHEIGTPRGSLNPYLVSQADDPALGHLAEQLATTEAKLQSLRVAYHTEAGQVQAQAATVDKLAQAIRSMIDNDLAAASTSLASINQAIARFNARIKTMPFESLRVISLQQSSDIYGQLYGLLMEKEQEAEVSKAAAIIDTRIVSPAELPLGIAWPRAKLTVTIGMLLGLFCGVAFAIARRSFSARLQSGDEARRIARLPVYGLIPRGAARQPHAGVLSAPSHSRFVEALRLLRSNLDHAASGGPAQVIAIMAATRDDTKSRIAVNLAKVLAEDGKSVILIDADLHGGEIHAALQLWQAPGLAEWLRTGVRPRLQVLADQRFQVLSAGTYPATPAALLTRAAFGRILSELKREFDVVLLDCPPLPLVADGMTLGREADLILSVVQLDHTPRTNFVMHTEMIATLHRPHAMVITGADPAHCGLDDRYDTAAGRGYGVDPTPRGLAARLPLLAGRLLTRSR